MFELSVKGTFSAAHNICGYEGECANIHGHNWVAEIRVGADKLDRIGMSLDFKVIKKILKKVIGSLDHTYLNENPFLLGLNPTAENLAIVISKGVDSLLPENAKLIAVTVWESDNSSITYYS